MSPNSDSILSQELSRRTALKALFGAASAAVLFGLPTRAHAAEASKETTGHVRPGQLQLARQHRRIARAVEQGHQDPGARRVRHGSAEPVHDVEA